MTRVRALSRPGVGRKGSDAVKYCIETLVLPPYRLHDYYVKRSIASYHDILKRPNPEVLQPPLNGSGRSNIFVQSFHGMLDTVTYYIAAD